MKWGLLHKRQPVAGSDDDARATKEDCQWKPYFVVRRTMEVDRFLFACIRVSELPLAVNVIAVIIESVLHNAHTTIASTTISTEPTKDKVFGSIAVKAIQPHADLNSRFRNAGSNPITWNYSHGPAREIYPHKIHPII
jgi:hypothetical protein